MTRPLLGVKGWAPDTTVPKLCACPRPLLDRRTGTCGKCGRQVR